MRPVDKYRGVGLWEIFPVTGPEFDAERIQSIPGITSAAAISRAPLSGNAMGMQFFIEGRLPEPGQRQGAAYFAITRDTSRPCGFRFSVAGTLTVPTRPRHRS